MGDLKIEPSMLVAMGAMAVAVIGALAGAVVTIMKGFADMRVQMSRLQGTASDIHDAVSQNAPGVMVIEKVKQ